MRVFEEGPPHYSESHLALVNELLPGCTDSQAYRLGIASHSCALEGLKPDRDLFLMVIGSESVEQAIAIYEQWKRS